MTFNVIYNIKIVYNFISLNHKSNNYFNFSNRKNRQFTLKFKQIKIYRGAPFQQISTYLNIAYIIIRNPWIKFVKTNSVLDLPKSGQPLKSSHGEKPNLLHFEKGPFFTANEVTENCNILKKVSVCIVCKHLYTVGFLEVGHRTNYCYLCNIFEIGKMVQGIFGNGSGEVEDMHFFNESRF